MNILTISFRSVAPFLVYFVAAVARRVRPDLAHRIPEGSLAYGVFLGALSLAGGLLNAACMVY